MFGVKSGNETRCGWGLTAVVTCHGNGWATKRAYARIADSNTRRGDAPPRRPVHTAPSCTYNRFTSPLRLRLSPETHPGLHTTGYRDIAICLRFASLRTDHQCRHDDHEAQQRKERQKRCAPQDAQDGTFVLGVSLDAVADLVRVDRGSGETAQGKSQTVQETFQARLQGRFEDRPVRVALVRTVSSY